MAQSGEADHRRLRYWVLATIPFIAGLGAVALFDPLPQSLAYHDFADKRPLWGIPNFADVVSNIAFLVAGLLGAALCLRAKPPGARLAWMAFFAGLVLVTFASAYYHWAPANATLFWDRLAMSVAFTALYVAMLTEFADTRLEKLLVPALVIGAATLVYWRVADDLRFYFALQATVFVSALVLLLGFTHAFRQKAWFAGALACYAAAIAFDFSDRAVFEASGGAISGHTIKHILAGAAGYVGTRMLRARHSATES